MSERNVIGGCHSQWELQNQRLQKHSKTKTSTSNICSLVTTLQTLRGPRFSFNHFQRSNSEYEFARLFAGGVDGQSGLHRAWPGACFQRQHTTTWGRRPSRQLFTLLQFMRAFLKIQFLAIGDAIAAHVYFNVVIKSIRQCVGSTLLTLHFQIV